MDDPNAFMRAIDPNQYEIVRELRVVNGDEIPELCGKVLRDSDGEVMKELKLVLIRAKEKE